MSARMKVSVDEGQQQASLDLLPESGMQGHIPLTLDQLTQLIFALGQARTQLLAHRPLPPLDSSPFSPVFKTQWAIQPEALTEGSVIAFQHPAYGAVGFVLAPNEIDRVVRTLTTHMGMVHSKPDEVRLS